MKKLTEWIEDELKPLLWVIARLEIYIPYDQMKNYEEATFKEEHPELDNIPF